MEVFLKKNRSDNFVLINFESFRSVFDFGYINLDWKRGWKDCFWNLMRSFGLSFLLSSDDDCEK